VIRLRQVALVATDLDPVVDELCSAFGLTVCFRDPGVAEFGLRNALMTIGDQFLEVVSPATDGTTAGRLLQKRGGDGGYMAIFEVDDLDERETTWPGLGVRVVWRGDFQQLNPGIRGRHLHPRDVGGAIVSLDQPEPLGSWRWAGPDWTAHHETSVVTSIAGISIGADDPTAMHARWGQLGLDHSVAFHPATQRGEGIEELHLTATDRSRAGARHDICGVTIVLV
jgi:Glyoxalase-like domain